MIAMTGNGKQEMREMDKKEGTKRNSAPYELSEQQFEDESSVLNYYRNLLRLREENPEIVKGVVSCMKDTADQHVSIMIKTWHNSRILIVMNGSAQKRRVVLPKKDYGYDRMKGTLSTSGEEAVLEDEMLTIPEYGIVVLK
jgi:alpha-amylase